MTREDAIQILKILKEDYWDDDGYGHETKEYDDTMLALDMAIKALEPKPYEKFENVKDHIYKLAGDYKCWDNRLTDDEAIELCHILEQEPCEDAISRKQAIRATYGFQRYTGIDEAPYEYAESILGDLPPVTPTKCIATVKFSKEDMQES